MNTPTGSAPPTEPPMVFRYTGIGTQKSMFFCVFFTAVFLWRLYSMVVRLQHGRSIGYDIFGMVIALPFIIISGYMISNKWGGSIEISEGRIRLVRRNGSVWMQGYLLNAQELLVTYPKGDTIPSMYTLKFKKGAIMFGTDVENLELLVSTIERRTGKTFQST